MANPQETQEQWAAEAFQAMDIGIVSFWPDGRAEWSGGIFTQFETMSVAAYLDAALDREMVLDTLHELWTTGSCDQWHRLLRGGQTVRVRFRMLLRGDHAEGVVETAPASDEFKGIDPIRSAPRAEMLYTLTSELLDRLDNPVDCDGAEQLSARIQTLLNEWKAEQDVTEDENANRGD